MVWSMNLYVISQSVNNGYDTFDAAVVCAKSAEDARRVEVGDGGAWCAPEHVSVRYIGAADPSVEEGVVLASFNAG